jgi:hypothetical protein
VQLPRAPGARETRWAHLLSGPVDVEAVEHAPRLDAEPANLKAEVARLSAEVADLRAIVDRLLRERGPTQ